MGSFRAWVRLSSLDSLEYSVHQGGKRRSGVLSSDRSKVVSYLLLVGCLVEELGDLLGELVVGAGPDATSLVCFDHRVLCR